MVELELGWISLPLSHCRRGHKVALTVQTMSHSLGSYWLSNSQVGSLPTQGSVKTTEGYLGEEQEEPLHA